MASQLARQHNLRGIRRGSPATSENDTSEMSPIADRRRARLNTGVRYNPLQSNQSPTRPAARPPRDGLSALVDTLLSTHSHSPPRRTSRNPPRDSLRYLTGPETPLYEQHLEHPSLRYDSPDARLSSSAYVTGWVKSYTYPSQTQTGDDAGYSNPESHQSPSSTYAEDVHEGNLPESDDESAREMSIGTPDRELPQESQVEYLEEAWNEQHMKNATAERREKTALAIWHHVSQLSTALNFAAIKLDSSVNKLYAELYPRALPRVSPTVPTSHALSASSNSSDESVEILTQSIKEEDAASDTEISDTATKVADDDAAQVVSKLLAPSSPSPSSSSSSSGSSSFPSSSSSSSSSASSAPSVHSNDGVNLELAREELCSVQEATKKITSQIVLLVDDVNRWQELQ